MKRAILSDIHGNLAALEAVLRDVEQRGCEQVYCLGDVVGYGPNPNACLDVAMRFDLCLLGNHDQAVLFDPEGFSSGAERAIFWTRAQLRKCIDESDEHYEQKRKQQQLRWDFLCELPRVVRDRDVLYVHGSARFPLSEYVFPEDVLNRRKLDAIFELIPGHAFQGHTHVPGIFTDNGQFIRPAELPSGYELVESGKRMINVGSVGQPRDGDPRACYVTLDGDIIRFHRVEYPVAEVAGQIYAIGELDRFLGDRLLQGR